MHAMTATEPMKNIRIIIANGMRHLIGRKGSSRGAVTLRGPFFFFR